MKEPVYILGGGRTDFKRNLKKEGKTIRDLITESGRKRSTTRRSIRAKSTPARSAISTPANLPSSCISARFCRRSIRSCTAFPPCTPRPRALPARSPFCSPRRIMGGFYDVVLVVGAEQQKTMSSLDGSDVLGAAADYHVEKPEYGDFMFPKLFGRSRRFTSINMASPRMPWRRSRIRITRMPSSIRWRRCATRI